MWVHPTSTSENKTGDTSDSGKDQKSLEPTDLFRRNHELNHHSGDER